MTLPLDDVLDALELSREEPSSAFLERLFARFNERVLFETASKIVRDSEVCDPAGKPRSPEIFWRDYLDRGTGGTCYARVAAFDALLSALGFSTRKALGKVEEDFDHAALFVGAGGREWLADVGFPLPALLPSGGGEAENGIAPIAATVTARGLHVRFLSGVPEGPRRLEIFREPVSEDEFLARWRTTFRPGARLLSAVALQRRDAHRVLSFARGEVRVDDLHSRARIPLTAERPRKLAVLYGVDEEKLSRAFELAGDPEPEIRDARITAYLSTPAEAQHAFDAIGTPEGYRRLMEGVADVAGEGWDLTFSAPGTGERGFEENVMPDPEHLALAVRRRYVDGREVPLSLRVEVRDGETWLVREVVLAGAREDLLVNDSARGRLAGTLAADLLGWSRLL